VLWQLVDQGGGAGEARVVESDGDWAVVEATQAFPIGATLRGVEAATGTEYRVKVRGGSSACIDTTPPAQQTRPAKLRRQLRLVGRWERGFAPGAARAARLSDGSQRPPSDH